MEKTNLQRHTSLYEKIIQEAENSPDAQNYKTVCEKLKKLVSISNRLKSKNRKISVENFAALTQSYETVKNACDEYFSNQNKFDDFEKKRATVIKDISNTLEKDIAVLKTCNPQKPMSLSEVMEKSRTRTIVFDKNSIQTVGAALSSRYAIRTNDGRKGFFTPTSVYNQDEKWTKALKPFENTFSNISGDCKAKLNLLKHDEEFQITVSRCIWKGTVTGADKNSPDVNKRVTNLAVELGMGKSEEDVKALFLKKPELYDSMIDFMNSATRIASQQRVMNVSGIKKGDTISTRNCAMSDVAQMLGCPHLLAHSSEMTIVVNGESIKGVFMETAEGSDTHHLKEDDLLFKAKGNSFGNVTAIQQVFDLQVLDFICGNTDRHSANLCYKLKKGSFGDVIFTGVQGIDNDCAFGRLKPSPQKQIMKLVHPKDMMYVTESMYTNLLSFKKENLQFKLNQYDFSKEEIDAVWDRYKMVMKELAKKKDLIVVDRAYLEQHPPVLNKKYNNYLSHICKMAYKCELNKYEVNVDENNKIKYAQEVHSANHIMLEKEDAITRLRETMIDAKAMIFNSSEYNLMEKQFSKIEKLTKKIKEAGPENVPESVTDELIGAYVALAEKTTKYMLLKSVVPATTRGEKRLALSKELQQFAHETLDQLGVKFEKEEEKVARKEENPEKELDADPEISM